VASETFSPTDKNAPSMPSTPDSSAAGDSARPRRRLGNWQTAGVDKGTAESQPPRNDAPVATIAGEAMATAARRATGSSISRRRQVRDSAEHQLDPSIQLSPRPHAAIGAQPSRLEALIVVIQANPEDVEALVELAEALRDRGMIQESRDIQRRLEGLQANSQRADGSPQTIPIPSAPLVPDFAAPIRGPRMWRGGTTQLLENPAPPSILTDFPLNELGFTIPLPGESQLSAEVREIVEQAGRELAAGQMMAAFDSCILAIEQAPDYTPVQIRLAEIHAYRRSTRGARIQAQTVIRLCEVEGRRDDARWMAQRVLLHASESDLNRLKTLVDCLVESNRVEEAARYGIKLIEISIDAGKPEQALAVSRQLCEMAPADERFALENVILLTRMGSLDQAIDCWKRAVSAGASEAAAKSSLAALIAGDHDLDHWQLLAESIDEMRSTHSVINSEAYVRTAAAATSQTAHTAGRAILEAAIDQDADAGLLATMCDPGVTTAGRALAAVAIAQKIGRPERLHALELAVSLLQTPSELDDSVWITLVGAAPRVEDLEADLGETLLGLGDGAGAIEVLNRALARDPQNAGTSELLADAYVRMGQTGAGLAVLDNLAIAHRSADRLEEMADVLHRMSALAPSNLKLKTRLIESYLQRGFVDEAQTELLARADLEEASGMRHEAAASLQRSADLSWVLGRSEDAFALYRRLIDLVPDDAGNRSALVNLFLQKGRIAEAAEQQRAVVDISLRSGSRHEAIAALHQVIGLTPDDSTAYYQLGDLLNAMGEHHQAEKVFRRLSLMNPGDDLARARTVQTAHLAVPASERTEAPAR